MPGHPHTFSTNFKAVFKIQTFTNSSHSFRLQLCLTKESYLWFVSLENIFCFTECSVLPQTPNIPAQDSHGCRRGWSPASTVELSRFPTAISISLSSSQSVNSHFSICSAAGNASGDFVNELSIFFFLASGLGLFSSLASLLTNKEPCFENTLGILILA